MTTLQLNGLTAVSVTLFHPWTGAWTAEVDFDLDVPVVPSGPAVLKIGNTVLNGTIDPDASGRFGMKARARVIGGHGGWHRRVSARQFHNDAGVLDAAVITSTAAEVGETAVVTTPKRLGVDFLRVVGPASQVLSGLDWWVTLAGVTTVGPRPTLPLSLDADVLTWDPHEQRTELATDAVVSPGAVLTDARFGTATIRDLEQRFDAAGARTTAWCSTNPASRLASALTSFIKQKGQLANLKTYRYRVVGQNLIDGRLTLQAIERASGAPDSIAIPPWYGLPGCSAVVTPGTEAAVVFLDGDPSKPAAVHFYGGAELATGVATMQSMTPFLAALFAFCTLAQAFFNFPLIGAMSGGTAQPVAGALATLAGLVSPVGLPGNFSTRTKAS